MLRCVSIGCKVNQAEIAEIKTRLGNKPDFSYERENGNVFIVNTCAVTNTAEAKCRKIIRRLVREYPDYKFIVTGCFVDAQSEKIKSLLRDSDIIVPNSSKSQIPQIIEGLSDGPQNKAVTESKNELDNDDSRTRAFLKIQDGCDEFCSYCIVPFLRVNLDNKPQELVVSDVKKLAAQGYKEVVLSGVNLGKYENLTGLLKEIVQINELKRIRLSSIEINHVNGKLIDFMAQNPGICPHFHIPLQSGSDRILDLMKRKYKVADYINKVAMIKGALDVPSITTDIIVGFPGETDDDFQETLNVCREVQFSKVHIFKFSPRQGTRAAEMPGAVLANTSKERYAQLNGLARQMALQYKNLFLGKTVSVLVEDSSGGFTDRYIKVKLKKSNACPVEKNQIVNVKVTKTYPDWVEGLPV